MQSRKRKYTIIYYKILGYQKKNLKLIRDNFRLVQLPNPGYDSRKLLQKADVILAPLGYYLDRNKIDKAPNLKIIASNTTGYPHIDVTYSRKRGIKVITLKGHKKFLKKITPTAELTLGLIIALGRNILPAHKAVLKGKWNRRPFGSERMLSRMSLGIAGYGRLGKMVASYAKCLGMIVRYYDPFVSCMTNSGIKRISSLNKLVKLSDIVSIHVPHEPSTEKMFNKRIFSAFKKGSYLINTSRGEVIDHKALLGALKKGALKGAALDVFESEFKTDFETRLNKHPLLQYARKHDNLIITPHIGGSTVDAWGATEEFTIKQIIKALKAPQMRAVKGK